MNVLTVNLVFVTFIFAVMARIYVFPRMSQLSSRTMMTPILLLHSFRNLGLMFLAAGATYVGMPSQFAYPAAFGDLLAAILALIALQAVRRSAPSGRLLVWVFTLEGTADLILAVVLATVYNAAPYMGAAYWIPAFWVPSLLVTHYMTYVYLVQHWRGSKAPAQEETAKARRQAA